MSLHIGCAGWAIPRQHRALFPEPGSQLERYAARLAATEINSSFHRPHRPATYARWAATVPEDFRFALKLPKTISHERRLEDVAAPLDAFLDESAALGAKRGPLLVQLPPSFAFDERRVGGFFERLRARDEGAVVCEPRHASWFAPGPDRLLAQHRVGRVAADPAKVPAAAEPGGWEGLVYFRLHGSPRVYCSAYEESFLDRLAAKLTRNVATWVIFDNTAAGAAAGDALYLAARVGAAAPAPQL